MNENEMVQDDEISLFDLWEKLREGWLAVVGGAVLGIAGAVLAIFLVPPKYESAMTIQIGKVGGNVIEAPEVVIARVGTPSFRLAAAQKAGDEKLVEGLTTNAAGDSAIGASLVKGTQLLSLTTSGNAPEAARQLSAAVIGVLQERHEALSRPLLAKISSDIALSKEKLAVIEREMLELSRAPSGGLNLKDTQFAPVSLLTSMRAQKQADVFGLRQQLTAMEFSMLPPATQPTQALEAPYIARRRFRPRRACCSR